MLFNVLIPQFFVWKHIAYIFSSMLKMVCPLIFLVARHNFHIQMKVSSYTFTNGFRTHSLTLVVAFKRRGNHLRARELELIQYITL